MTNNTLLTDTQLTNLTLDGEAFLLSVDERGNENVMRYSANDMVEVFTQEQLDALAGGQVVTLRYRVGFARYTNMLGAARARIEING